MRTAAAALIFATVLAVPVLAAKKDKWSEKKCLKRGLKGLCGADKDGAGCPKKAKKCRKMRKKCATTCSSGGFMYQPPTECGCDSYADGLSAAALHLGVCMKEEGKQNVCYDGQGGCSAGMRRCVQRSPPPSTPPPPLPPPNSPGSTTVPTLSFEFTLAGDANSFDAATFKTALADQLNVTESRIELNVVSGSVVVEATVSHAAPSGSSVSADNFFDLKTCKKAVNKAAKVTEIEVEKKVDTLVASTVVEAGPSPPPPESPPLSPPSNPPFKI